MAIFPQLAPVSRSYNPGVFPVTVETSFSSNKTFFRHGQLRFGLALELQYSNLTEAEARLIRDHYKTVANTAASFLLPSIIWAGLSSPTSVASANTKWKYTSAPNEQHKPGGYIDAVVQLLSVR